MTWRDSASQQTRDDLDDALSAGISAAQELLGANGEFYPFSVVVRHDGRTEILSARPDDDDPHTPQGVLDALDAAIRDQLPDVRAAAVVTDVTLPRGDAIQVVLEHEDGQAVAVQLPYTRKSRGNVRYGGIQASEGVRRLWV